MLSSYRGNANASSPSASNKPILVEFDGDPIIIPGNVTIEGDLLVEGDETIEGDLTVEGQILAADGSAAAPGYSFENWPSSGIYAPNINSIVINANGANILFGIVNDAIYIQDRLGFSFNADLFLQRDAANILAQRNGVNAQAHRVYNTFTDAGNYERISLLTDVGFASLSTEQAGTGTPLQLRLGTTGAASIFFFTNSVVNWGIDAGGILFANTDNALDIGVTGAVRPRSIYVGTSIQIEANNGLKLTAQTSAPGAGLGTLTNAPSAGDPDFWLPVTINGTNHWIPAWAA